MWLSGIVKRRGRDEDGKKESIGKECKGKERRKQDNTGDEWD